MENLEKNIILNEEIVLASLFNNQKLFYKYMPVLNKSFFISKKNKNIFDVFKKIYFKKLDVNLDVFSELSRNINRKTMIKLCECFRDSEKNIDYHIEKLKINSLKIKLFNENLNELHELLLDPEAEFEDLTALVSEINLTLNEANFKLNSGVKNRDEIYNQYVDLLARRVEGSAFGTTGLNELDKVMVEGFLDGKLTILAAYTSIGKTTFASIILDNMIDIGNKVVYFALEPQVYSIIDILVARRFDLRRDELIKNTKHLDDDLLDEIEDEVYYLIKESDLVDFVDDPFINFSEVEKILSQQNYKLCIIDLFEKFKDIPAGDTQIITKALDDIQTIAKKTNTHILILHQLSRAVTKRKSKRPMLSDLLNSSKYEQVADNILFLHREKYYNQDCDEDILEVIIAKQKEGARDISVYYYFKPEKCILTPVLKNRKELENSKDFG